MRINRLFREYPFLFFILAAVIVSNNIFKYAPGQVLRAPISYIIPAVMIAFGAMGYAWKAYEKKKESK